MGGDRGRGRGARGRGYSRGRRERKRNNDDDRNRNNDDGARRSDLARRVLCLHGSEQTATLFAQRLAPLAKRCGDSLVFVDAPHALPLREGQAAPCSSPRARAAELDDVGARRRALLVAGRGDALVPPEDTLALLPGAEPYVHDKGHCLPCRARDVDAYLAFFNAGAAGAGRRAADAAAGRCHAAARVAAGAAGAGPVDAATAEARGEEIEALAAIYGDDFERCGAWGAKIRLDSEHFADDIFLTVAMLGAYPAGGGRLKFGVESMLSLLDLPTRVSSAIARAAAAAVADDLAAGEPCVLAAVQGANDFLAAGDRAGRDFLAAGDPREAAAGGDDADDATADDDGGGDDDDDASAAAGLVVGVVGKPSAGKSTFFNAVTRSTGALAAKCAAYPFTTIDPNVREGLFACGDRDPALGLGLELAPCPPHGRDAKGRRLLPALLKDVAGLVPGASRGEGKGNRFLNDLADADALVHVVDASAETDASGGAVDAADAPEDALAREIAWIREELHRWIAGNVARKWHSVVRLATHRRDSTAALDRLLGLFTGYAAAPVVVRRAIAVAGLDERVAALDAWGSSELHRLVAAFLEIRFPTRGRRGGPRRRAARGDVGARRRGGVPGAAAHLAAWGTTGVLDAVSRAVALARPAYAYPVADLDSLGRSGGRLADCVVLRPHATVEDVFTALKRRGLGGDFVRADVISDDGAKRRQAKARDPVGDDCRVVKVATNRKNPWQRNL
ncbi:phosphorelay sensor kinase [Aureococcus anophagefferens]|nr:phosphorelay sensor kinase [Aureococcus anophagefferens]